ncbi:N-acetyltransferase [Affinibrenneria salicis]|uniref:N-acetyltransferase n=2 Tax=Affinibrenneria salicis TaxID=2590031 RepID=A0A5J5FUU7_9GAMM|nr:N-acetyltransferase [Affinibrenneria salicis]
MALWLHSTTQAHPFIEPAYWRESAAALRERYLPSACTWVAGRAGEMDGFISVFDERFIGALFVHPARLGQGTGHALLRHVQRRSRWLSLEVYEQNQRACAFYRRHGFRVAERLFNEETQHWTLIMNWWAPGQIGF